MLLYHFTDECHLDSIRQSGLLPNVRCEGENENRHMTLGRPVVWLTTSPEELWFAGSQAPEGVFRITVRLGLNSKRLAHYETWLRKQKALVKTGDGDITTDEMCASMMRTFGGQFPPWWIYFGTIAPERLVEGSRVKFVGKPDAA